MLVNGLWKRHTKWCATLYLTMGDWTGNKLSITIKKTSGVAYKDVLNESNLVWCVKGLIVTHSKFSVTWKVRPQMGIIS